MKEIFGNLLCLLFFYVASGQLLLVSKKEVTVKIGRDVYLKRDDLVFTKTTKGEECRVEVVQNDPITQRVGYLEPQIFDCSFLPHTVHYVHNGSPLLQEDQVRLRVHKFTHVATVSETFLLDIRVDNSSHSAVITRGLRSVIVPEFNGISNTIDSSVIRFHHSGNQNVSCTVSFSKYKSVWPLAGQIVIGNRRQNVEALKKSCRDFLYSNLHYQHTKSPSPNVDYLPLTIELYDPSISDEVKVERYFLPIHIKGALQNSPPRSSFMSMYMMDVDQFVLSTIIPGVISAEDFETNSIQLVYNISKMPRNADGYFVNLKDHTTPIYSFLQDDLENHRIAFQPPSYSISQRHVFDTEFTVYDSHFVSSTPIVLHIAVRPSRTNGPRVSYNKGLVLLEGQERPLTTNSLKIVDSDNLEKVRLYVTGGLQHGRLEKNSRRAIALTVQDLQQGSVRYIHDDSDSMKDQIDFRVSDGVNTVVINFPIDIIPKDDTAPYIVNNLGIEVNEGEMKRITSSMLMAHDIDSVDRNIEYLISQPPSAGEIIKRQKSSNTGTRVNKFKQRDIQKGLIFYRHFGHEEFKDLFTFKLRDQQRPPNESDLETFHILINPVHENPPQLAPDATRLVHVLETDVAFITKAELQYTDVETDDNQLSYMITSAPYFVYNTGNEDAGKIIATHNISSVTKDGSLPAIQTFKQEDINHMKIAYMPPMSDIGPESRLVRFVYTVQDSSGNKVLGQYFEIDVQPVNDKPPVFITSKLLVEEGGILGLSTNQLSASDEDTLPADLVFILDERPAFGVMQKGGNALNEGDMFKLEDLRRKDIRYIHDGADVVLDTFTVTVSDGVNRASKVLSVDIVPIDDKAPHLKSNLRPRLIVSEGGSAIITSSVLAATDDDTDDHQLVFLIVKQPNHGIMQLGNQPATKFTQKNVEERRVRYIHTGGEIGNTVVRDTVTFIVSDQNYLATSDLPVYDLNITITPVDNSKPIIITGQELAVNESSKISLTPAVITAKDPDTDPDEIRFIVLRHPQWGYLENSKTESSNHRGVEPVYDEVQLYATDGKQRSTPETLRIKIKPFNDEEPDVMLQGFNLDEGGQKVIDQSMVDALDMDFPKDVLTFSISQAPKHGEIVIMLHTRNGDVEAAIQDFTAEELHAGMKLKYKHDNSENFRDNFAVTVSDGKHQVKKMCNISINPLNDEGPEVTKNAGLQLEYGDYAMISSVVLQSIDPDNSENEVFYILVSVPKKGSLQFCSDPFSPTRASECSDMHVGNNFTQHDIDMNRIRYIHTTSMGSTETDSFLFLLSDGTNRRQVETFEIRIRNSRKANLALLNKGLQVREGQRTPLSTDNLSATDESTKADEIVFAITRQPNLGQMEFIDEPLKIIRSFTQLDIASRKVVYNHMTKSDITTDSFAFTVTNGLSQAKDGVFKISIDPLDTILPSLQVNSLIEVLQGSDIEISPQHLLSQDPDTPDVNVTYVLAKPPTYGRLFNRGIAITRTFTQSEINLGFIVYESDGSHAGLDNFLFTLSDGKHDGFLVNSTLQLKPVICSIFIKPVVNDAPKLLVSSHPETLEYFGRDRYGFRLNSRNLKAIDSDTSNSKLKYVMVKRPSHGHIENVATKRFVRRRFSQKDLDDNNLLYILDKRRGATNDSFKFRLIDGRGNTLDNLRFDMRWSKIELERSHVVVCEDIGTLAITLKRSGALEQMAFVGIKVKEMSARQGKDFIPSTAQQVQFNPGMTHATWDVLIPDDGIQENNEKFRILLDEPVNAVLGRKVKTNVRIINAENGACPQYLGMISKNHKDVLEVDSFFSPNNNKKNTDTIISFNNFNQRGQQPNPFDNTYNTDPKESSGDSGANANTRDGLTGKKSSRSSKKRRRNRKKKKNRKSKSRKTKKINSNDKGSSGNLFNNLSSPSLRIQAPQQCTSTTRGLLHFDDFTQRMYQCDGTSWKAWKADGSDTKDAPPNGPVPAYQQQCPEGKFFEGKCYVFVTDRKTWDEAQRACEAITTMPSVLTPIHSKSHLNFLAKLARKKSFWIGLNNKQTSTQWVFLRNGNIVPLVSYTRWGKGQPKSKGSKRNCVLVNKRRKWRNLPCDKPKKRYICEGIPSQNIPSDQPRRSRGKRKKRIDFFGFK
ncbi:hypothetical protein FSP39_010172 [Pinctada imbricata]|uniref:C-type lectin domain-containing protein n=1 Tax=Pinctada imbricata TaxID=66713 RepID=A0AA89C118_PINIB|nr:hypothetical protein FSP39_010172 [Pinctada imbricata]